MVAANPIRNDHQFWTLASAA